MPCGLSLVIKTEKAVFPTLGLYLYFLSLYPILDILNQSASVLTLRDNLVVCTETLTECNYVITK